MFLAIDPGSYKSGLVIVDKDLNIYYRKIIKSSNLKIKLKDLFNKYNIELIILGNGTYSSNIEEECKKLIPKIPIEIVDEAYTTYEAQQRYREDNHQHGLQKIFKILNWKPKQAIDDYVALILVERYLNNK